MSAFLLAAAIWSLVELVPTRLWAQTSSAATPPTAENPLAPEKNPPGDIPDNQVFVEYRSSLCFSIKVPEGWARHETYDSAGFSDKYNTIALVVAQRMEAATVTSVKEQEVGELERTGRAVRVRAVTAAKLPSGSAVVISYSSNSEPNPVTEKAIRQENDRYLFWKSGKQVTLTLSAPFGADNADQWGLIAKSFRWQ
jgi:hypothetical protein